MTLHKWVRELVEKYDFVTRTEFKLAIFKIFYEKDSKERFKSLPYRADKDQLAKVIEAIRKDIDYYEKKKERDGKIKKQMSRKESSIVFSH